MAFARVALGAYAALSLVTFSVYAWDKSRAARGGRRVPEARLHLLSWLGGFVGAALGMRLLRHKTRKPFFALVIVLAAVLHLSLWGLVLWLRSRGS